MADGESEQSGRSEDTGEAGVPGHELPRVEVCNW